MSAHLLLASTTRSQNWSVVDKSMFDLLVAAVFDKGCNSKWSRKQPRYRPRLRDFLAGGVECAEGPFVPLIDAVAICSTCSGAAGGSAPFRKVDASRSSVISFNSVLKIWTSAYRHDATIGPIKIPHNPIT